MNLSRNDRSQRGRAMSRNIGGGFTLIELLVVVGIIAVLMAVLLPALGRAREEVYKISCASNLRQWGTALSTFAGENNRQLPDATRPGGGADRPMLHPSVNETQEPWVAWHDFMRGYLSVDLSDPQRVADSENTVTWCPSQGDRHRGAAHTVLGYFYFPNRRTDTSFWLDPAVEGWMRKDRIDGPYSRAPLMSDEKWSVPPATHFGQGGGNAAHISPQDDERTMGGNFLFEDGSVSWRTGEEVLVGGGWSSREYYFKISIPGLSAD